MTPITCRTKDEYMIQIAVCPGKPKDLVSYLQPVIAEVNDMYQRGIVIKKQGEERFRGSVAILGITGDIPGIDKLISFAGHTHTYGCRICLVKADSPAPNCTHGKYFSGVGTERSIDSLIEGDIVSKYDHKFNRDTKLILSYSCMS